MAALAFALHILGAVVWVGGMFAIYVCLRPALVTLEPRQRLQLMRVTFQKFFPWVWTAVLLLLASGYSMVFIVFGGFAAAGLHVHLMQGIGWLMIALFVWSRPVAGIQTRRRRRGLAECWHQSRPH